MHKHSIEIGARTVEYWEAGEQNARTIILLSGGFGDAFATWGGFMPLLAKNFHVCAPQLPGYGASSVIADLSITGMLRWVDELREAMYLGSAVIVGASMSGLVARAFAAANPEIVPAVVLVSGGAPPQVPPLVRALAGVPVVGRALMRGFARAAYDPRALAQFVARPDELNDDFTRAVNTFAPALTRYAGALLVSRLPQDLTPRVPTLIVWGEQDGFSPLGVGEGLRDAIPGAVFAPIVDCGHLPYIEAPEAFAFQVTSFLERISRPPSSGLPGAGMLTPPPQLPDL